MIGLTWRLTNFNIQPIHHWGVSKRKRGTSFEDFHSSDLRAMSAPGNQRHTISDSFRWHRPALLHSLCGEESTSDGPIRETLDGGRDDSICAESRRHRSGRELSPGACVEDSANLYHTVSRLPLGRTGQRKAMSHFSSAIVTPPFPSAGLAA